LFGSTVEQDHDIIKYFLFYIFPHGSDSPFFMFCIKIAKPNELLMLLILLVSPKDIFEYKAEQVQLCIMAVVVCFANPLRWLRSLKWQTLLWG